MEEFGGTAGQAQRLIDAALRGVREGTLTAAPDPRARLAELASWLRLRDRMDAIIAAGIRAVDDADDAMTAQGSSTRTWLAQTGRVTPGRAAALIKDAHRLGRFGAVADAHARAGISTDQAGAIVDALDRLPGDLSAGELAAGEATMIDHATAQHFDPAMLRRLGNHLVEIIAPEIADEHDRVALERAERRAHQARSLTFTADGHGTISFRGRLPQLDGEAFVAVIDAHATRDRSVAGRDPSEAELSSPEQRRADGLVELISHAQACRTAPTHGGERPRIVVTIGHEQLRALAGSAPGRASGESLRTGARVSLASMRRLACDAGLLPVVLGGAGQPLDVGREHRLVTAPIRATLTVRDRGCVLPGCDRPPERCEAHHIIPWQAGGATRLTNLVLLCRHHHGLIEPRPGAAAGSQWEVRIAADGLPEVLPPSRVDAARRPLRHPRLLHRRAGSGKAAGGPGPPDDDP
ncbi:hypothetical protein GGQ54_002307 [Naumannella cuiyingiana]|uniref:HNH nuclease domain-containing protein n=1 Tax=Naumannella cuiyingiana TaxID=1347891 RepID=A0A7Z0DA38_9ACTN|nr:HNH endonuclease signature motif containing protein [Naumannella cuiyingiana]NYI71747.1 hypothetical protein [Naumannella cuiyingiana]